MALDERGRQWTTVKLADSISGWMKNGGDTAFIIGGADGLDASIKNSADEVLALSALTLPTPWLGSFWQNNYTAHYPS